MCSSSWPVLLDLTKDECKRILRNMELNAYESMVSVFRAQGDLSKDKRRLLTDLQQFLSISTERHRAEVRRAVNDEKLTTVAQCIAGSDVSSEWQVEGRRLVPILPRLVPQTAFSITADSASQQQSQVNRTLPPPASTGNKQLAGSSMPVGACNPGNQAPVAGRAPSPTSASNLLMLQRGMALHMKDEERHILDDDTLQKQRVRTYSEGLVQPRPSAPHISTYLPTARTPPVPSVVPQHVTPQGSPPIKFTVAKSPSKHHAVTATSSGQKVIIVSSAVASGTSTISAMSGAVQKSVSAVPLVKSSTSSAVTTTVSTVMYPRSSIMVSGNTPGELQGRSNIISMAGTAPGTTPTPVFNQSPSAGTPRPRVRTISARPRAHQMVRAPNTPQSVAPTTSNIHIRPASKPTIHIKQEGGMKIITQGTPATAGRILPKPSPSQVLVVTTAQSGVVNQRTAISASHVQGGKVLNISTSGGQILATSAPRSTSSSVVTVNPKTLQLTTVKGTAAATSTKLTTPSGVSKPNVVIVQKAQPKKGNTTPTVQVARGTGPMSSPFEKELVSFLQRQEPGAKTPTQQQRSVLERKLGRPPGTSEGLTRKHVVVRQKSDGGRVRSVTLQGNSKSSILAELIQAVSLSQESGTSGEQIVTLADGTKTIVSTGTQEAPHNQWVEYDVQSDGSPYIQQGGKLVSTENMDAPAIKALLDLQAGSSKITAGNTLRSAIELGSIHGNGGEIRLEPISAEDRADIDPDIQIVSTSGLDDVPSTTPITVKKSVPYMQRQKQVQLQDDAIQLVGVEPAPEGRAGDLRVASTDESQELVAEIDPRTGAIVTDGFHGDGEMDDVDEVAIQVISSEDHEAEQAALLANNRATKTIILNTGEHKKPGSSAVNTQPVTTVIDVNHPITADDSEPSMEKMDFLSNALNEAQIDLECYQFSEEDGGNKVLVQDGSANAYVSEDDSANQATTLVSILSRPSQAQTSSGFNYEMSESVQLNNQATPHIQTMELHDKLPDLLVSTPQVTPASRPVTKVTTLQGKTVVTAPQVKSKQFIPIHDVEGRKAISTIHVIKSSGTPTNSRPGSLVSSVSVASEPGSLDPGHLKLEDLTSHQLDSDLSEDVLVSAGFAESAGDIAQSIRLSKRKRKAPLPADEITSPTQAGWTRLAMGVLQRVMRVRGAYKEKGQMNAASWFTQPVDPREVPDYYNIIENPMDFATIKRKLEMNRYLELEEFHADMLLVRDNCHRYNPQGTEVRRDCDQVFSTYMAEYDKVLARWKQGVASSPNSKKSRLDKSPVRH